MIWQQLVHPGAMVQGQETHTMEPLMMPILMWSTVSLAVIATALTMALLMLRRPIPVHLERSSLVADLDAAEEAINVRTATMTDMLRTHMMTVDLVERARVAIWAFDVNGRCTYSQGGGLVDFNVKPGQMVGVDLISDEVNAYVYHYILAQMQAGTDDIIIRSKLGRAPALTAYHADRYDTGALRRVMAVTIPDTAVVIDEFDIPGAADVRAIDPA